MKNRRGFTLIELLVTITIIGIIMIMTLPAIHNLQRENQKKKFDDYERAVLEAAKAYEDQYEEDLFGRSDTGCASINYVDLVNKKLLTTTKIAGYECNNDKNGIIIRKVKGTSYYEVYLTCNKGNNDKKNLTGNNDDYTDNRDNHCNTGEDHDPPILSIKCDGDNYNHAKIGDDGNRYYRTELLPELTVQASDNITGLEKNQYVTYEWKIYNAAENILNNIPNKIEKNKATFNTKDGAGSTSRKKVRIIEELKKANTTGKTVVDLSGENIIDRAGNKLSLETDSAKETCQYFYDNTPPEMEIRITGNNTGREYSTTSGQWINEPITTTVIVTDKTKNNTNNIYSGIDMTSFKNSNIGGAKLSEKDENTKTHTYKLVDTNRKQDDTYTVCDKVGNCISQTVKIRVDTIYPVCKSKGGISNWINRNITIEGSCEDQGDPDHYSKCRKDTYSQVYSAEQSITNATAGEACDNAGNCVMCSEDQHVHIDKTRPNCTTEGESTEWATSRTIKFNCEDPISGGVRSNCTQKTSETITYTSTTKITSKTWNIKDNATNTRTCTKNNVQVYMDNTAPKCKIDVTNEKQADQAVKITGTCTESDAEIKRTEWLANLDDESGYSEANSDSFVYPNPYSYVTYSKNTGSYKFICTNKAGMTCSQTTKIKESTCKVHRVYSTDNYCSNSLCDCVECSKGSAEITNQWMSGNLCHTYWNCEGDEKVTSGKECGYEEA